MADDRKRKGSDPLSVGTEKGSDPFFYFFYEMGLPRADFLRLLPVAVGNEPYRVEGDDIAATGGPIAWRIRIEERPKRAFGPVGLPVLAVTLDLGGMSASEARAFVDRFLLGFQRAGG